MIIIKNRGVSGDEPPTYTVTLNHKEYAAIGASLDLALDAVNEAPDANAGEAELSDLVRGMQSVWDLDE